MPWSNPFAAMLRAAVAHRRGNRDLTAELLHVADAGFGLANMELFQMAARMRLAQVVANDEARQTILDVEGWMQEDRKSTRLNSSHLVISYAVFCLKKKK